MFGGVNPGLLLGQLQGVLKLGRRLDGDALLVGVGGQRRRTAPITVSALPGKLPPYPICLSMAMV